MYVQLNIFNLISPLETSCTQIPQKSVWGGGGGEPGHPFPIVSTCPGTKLDRFAAFAQCQSNMVADILAH